MGKYTQIKTQEELLQTLATAPNEMRHYAFQGVDFTAYTSQALAHNYRECLFLGCRLPMGLKKQSRDSLYLPRMGETFDFPTQLYTPEQLYAGYNPHQPHSYEKCFDARVYRHYLHKGSHTSDVKETLARALHDHSVTDSLRDYLTHHDPHKLVGIMGGHGLSRRDTSYAAIARLAKRLTEAGFLMITGGGPGAMEATHLGAWMAGRPQQQLHEALDTLRAAEYYTDPLWFPTAWQVRDAYPHPHYQSLGIPTWHYGHEPSTPFATHIAKYFDNSIREDGILSVASGGIIYAPGSAGTLQEIFQEAVQNHYLTFGYASPMIFLDKQYWTEDVPIWPLLTTLAARGTYKNLILCLTDSDDEVERVLSGDNGKSQDKHA